MNVGGFQVKMTQRNMDRLVKSIAKTAGEAMGNKVTDAFSSSNQNQQQSNYTPYHDPFMPSSHNNAQPTFAAPVTEDKSGHFRYAKGSYIQGKAVGGHYAEYMDVMNKIDNQREEEKKNKLDRAKKILGISAITAGVLGTGYAILKHKNIGEFIRKGTPEEVKVAENIEHDLGKVHKVAEEMDNVKVGKNEILIDKDNPIPKVKHTSRVSGEPLDTIVADGHPVREPKSFTSKADAAKINEQLNKVDKEAMKENLRRAKNNEINPHILQVADPTDIGKLGPQKAGSNVEGVSSTVEHGNPDKYQKRIDRSARDEEIAKDQSIESRIDDANEFNKKHGGSEFTNIPEREPRILVSKGAELTRLSPDEAAIRASQNKTAFVNKKLGVLSDLLYENFDIDGKGILNIADVHAADPKYSSDPIKKNEVKRIITLLQKHDKGGWLLDDEKKVKMVHSITDALSNFSGQRHATGGIPQNYLNHMAKSIYDELKGMGMMKEKMLGNSSRIQSITKSIMDELPTIIKNAYSSTFAEASATDKAIKLVMGDKFNNTSAIFEKHQGPKVKEFLQHYYGNFYKEGITDATLTNDMVALDARKLHNESLKYAQEQFNKSNKLGWREILDPDTAHLGKNKISKIKLFFNSLQDDIIDRRGADYSNRAPARDIPENIQVFKKRPALADATLSPDDAQGSRAISQFAPIETTNTINGMIDVHNKRVSPKSGLNWTIKDVETNAKELDKQIDDRIKHHNAFYPDKKINTTLLNKLKSRIIRHTDVQKIADLPENLNKPMKEWTSYGQKYDPEQYMRDKLTANAPLEYVAGFPEYSLRVAKVMSSRATMAAIPLPGLKIIPKATVDVNYGVNEEGKLINNFGIRYPGNRNIKKTNKGTFQRYTDPFTGVSCPMIFKFDSTYAGDIAQAENKNIDAKRKFKRAATVSLPPSQAMKGNSKIMKKIWLVDDESTNTKRISR